MMLYHRYRDDDWVRFRQNYNPRRAEMMLPSLHNIWQTWDEKELGRIKLAFGHCKSVKRRRRILRDCSDAFEGFIDKYMWLKYSDGIKLLGLHDDEV